MRTTMHSPWTSPLFAAVDVLRRFFLSFDRDS